MAPLLTPPPELPLLSTEVDTIGSLTAIALREVAHVLLLFLNHFVGVPVSTLPSALTASKRRRAALSAHRRAEREVIHSSAVYTAWVD